MLALILAITAATASPAPSPAVSPSPSASAGPLKTIVTVRSTTFCEQMATHLNSAITSAVTNDQTLGTTILTLRSNDLAGSDLSRQHEIHRLQDLADGIYRNYRSGLGEVGRLRALAKSAQDADEKVQLKAAADALGGVLYRQHLLQRDLDGFVAYLYAADMQADTNRDTLTREFIGNDEADYPYGPRTRTEPYLNILQTMAQESVHPYMYRTPDTDVALAVN
ncbi:MAG TPA: hypothetical protein VFN49_05055, partial [Candidatus Aquilonibacter sp.]|nr:hypothetical protein [Candidatus Aquilonibacter sp.]